MTLPEDKREDDWKKALQPLRPDAIPSPALFARVSALATEAGTTANARLPKRWGSAFCLRIAAAAVAAAAVVTGAAIYGPKMALASTLRTVASNLRQAQGIHYRITFFKNGRKALSQEIWSRDNQWRLEADTGGSRLIQIKANGKFWNYDPARRVAWYQKDTGTSLFANLNEEHFRTYTVNALSGGKGEDLGMVDYQGNRLQQIAVPSPVQKMPFLAPVPGRTVFTIDRERMLPAITEQQIREGGDWVTVVRAEIDLTGDVSPDKFTIHDKGVRLYDINTYGAQAGSRFSRPLAVKKFSTRTIAVRDVQANRDGDIFVLYTDGSTREKDRSIYYDVITDNIGTLYAGTAGIGPFMYHQNPESSRGMTVGKEILKGICMVPLAPLPPGSPAPRLINLTIGFAERQNKKSFFGRTKFTLPVRQTKKLLPDYSADLAALSLSGGDEKEFKRDRESGRWTSYFNRQDWNGIIRTTDRAISEGVVDVNTHLSRAHAFYKLERLQEARKALAGARKTDENGFYADEIAKQEAEIERGVPRY